MDIKDRKSFADVDLGCRSYIEYFPYKSVPDNKSFRYGKNKSIVLLNEKGELEKLSYRLTGAVEYGVGMGYQWIFGEIFSVDRHGCLVFNYNAKGDIIKITLSFCGKSPDVAEFERMTKNIKYPAEFTALDVFDPSFFH